MSWLRDLVGLVRNRGRRHRFPAKPTTDELHEWIAELRASGDSPHHDAGRYFDDNDRLERYFEDTRGHGAD